MNKELQEEGYYMGDFEFKMMGCAYWLDKGRYFKAIHGLNKLHGELNSKETLIKIPEFSDEEEEYEFYHNLQNPKTGAFIDDDYPYCTYNEVTENVLIHLDALAKETGQPLKLKYPLSYLDDINTPEKLVLFLDDASHVGWIASQFPHTSFIFARSLLSYLNGEGVIGENNLYEFSPEWKEALLRWFYDNQDPETGFWGPKSRIHNDFLVKDVTNTASVIKTFVDRNGNDIYEDFPLRYKDEMFKTTLVVLSEPMPRDEDLYKVHEWNLKMNKGISMLTRYLWNDASEGNRDTAKDIIENYIKIKFEKNYVSCEGAFSYYPHGEHATLDGMGNFFLFKDLGAFSEEKQKQMWGGSIKDLGVHKTSEMRNEDVNLLLDYIDINSVRIYSDFSDDDYLKNVEGVFYPRESVVLDILDLTPQVQHWVETTHMTMGNWVSKESVLQELETMQILEVPVYENEIPVEKINELLWEHGEVFLVGFDVLQVPRYKILFEFKR